MGNPDCQIHAATHCTLSTSELCFVVLSEKNPAAMQSWVCRLSEAPCRTRVCWIIRCSLPSEVSQLPNLAPYFLLVGSCRVSWVVQALKPAHNHAAVPRSCSLQSPPWWAPIAFLSMATPGGCPPHLHCSPGETADNRVDCPCSIRHLSHICSK